MNLSPDTIAALKEIFAIIGVYTTMFLLAAIVIAIIQSICEAIQERRHLKKAIEACDRCIKIIGTIEVPKTNQEA